MLFSMAQIFETVVEPKKPKFTRGNGNKPVNGFTRDSKPLVSAGKKRAPNQHTAKLGPYSKWGRLHSVDLRTSEGLIVHRLRRELTEHCGGNPSVVQRTIIERCCWLQLRLALMDRKLAKGHDINECDSNSYISWTNALVRTMSRLGVTPPKRSTTRRPLSEILAERGVT